MGVWDDEIVLGRMKVDGRFVEQARGSLTLNDPRHVLFMRLTAERGAHNIHLIRRPRQR